MKSVIIISIIVGLLFATTCTDKTNNRECVIHRTDINLAHESFTHLLSDKNNQYLFGVIEEDKLDFRTNEITIDQAKVGEEKNWTSFSRNIPGVCQVVCQTKGNIYLISEQYETKDGYLKDSKDKLYKISKEGGGIVELYEWDKGNLIFGGLHFYSDEIGFLVIVYNKSNKSSNREFLKTEDGGKSWKILNLKSPIGNLRRSYNRVYSLSDKDEINSVDKKGFGFVSLLQFDLKVRSFVVGDNNDYWLLGKDGDKTVLKYYQDGKGTHIKTFSDHPEFFPERVYKYNDLIVVLAGKIDHNMLLGFGGTRPKMYLSKDRGLTWAEQSLKEALYLEPVSFYKDERITAYAGLGKVLSCSLK